MPTATPRAQSASRTWSFQSYRSLPGRVWRDHRLFTLVFAPAVLLRVCAELGYQWQVWFNDSFDYIQNTVHFQLDTTRVSGYTIWLKILQPFHTYALVTILQHLMGLAVAVMIYALARHRFSVPALWATLAVVPVLYDGFQIQLEHLIMADAPFLFVITLAMVLLLWDQRPPSLVRCAVIGLLLGIADVLRSVALPLLAVFAVYMVIRRIGWRRVGALIVMCALPVVAYAGWFDIQHGQFAMTESNGVFLYSRVMTFAECPRMSLPADEKWLCTTVPPDKRPIAQAYIWTSGGYNDGMRYTAPLGRYGASKFTPVPNKMAENFAIKAIEAQPLDYLRAAWDDTWRVFGWNRQVFPQAATYDEYLFSKHPLPIASYNKVQIGPWGSYAAAYVQGDPYTHVVEPFGEVVRLWQRYIWLPGTVYGLVLLIGFGGMALAWRRVGGEALLPWATSVMLIVFPAATAEFDYRYVLPAVPFACLAAAITFAPGTPGGNWLRRLIEGMRRDRVAPAGAGSGSGSSPSDAGDDERDLTPDSA